MAIRVVGTIVVLAAFYELCWMPFRGNRVVRRVNEREIAARGQTRPVVASAARDDVALLDSVARYGRNARDYHVAYATTMLSLGRNEDAVAELGRAIAIQDNPDLRVQRGQIELNLGQSDAALADFTVAVRFNKWLIDRVPSAVRDRVEQAASQP